MTFEEKRNDSHNNQNGYILLHTGNGTMGVAVSSIISGNNADAKRLLTRLYEIDSDSVNGQIGKIINYISETFCDDPLGLKKACEKIAYFCDNAKKALKAIVKSLSDRIQALLKPFMPKSEPVKLDDIRLHGIEQKMFLTIPNEHNPAERIYPVKKKLFKLSDVVPGYGEAVYFSKTAKGYALYVKIGNVCVEQGHNILGHTPIANYEKISNFTYDDFIAFCEGVSNRTQLSWVWLSVLLENNDIKNYNRFCAPADKMPEPETEEPKEKVKEMETEYKIPGGTENALSKDVAKQTHSLIGGATRSGKSVFLNTFVTDMLKNHYPLSATSAPAESRCGFILIDPKRGVEFGRYKNLPHTIAFATDAESAVYALEQGVEIMNSRYDKLASTGSRKYTGDDIYIIIDEMADISGNKAVSALIDKIARLGGAAAVHLILATQQPLITTGAIASSTKANMTCQIALRCEEPKDSRAIIRQNGAEELPLNGFCLIRTPYGKAVRREAVPFTDDAEIDYYVRGWVIQKPPLKDCSHKWHYEQSHTFTDPQQSFCKVEPKHGFLSNLFYFLTGIRVTVHY